MFTLSIYCSMTRFFNSLFLVKAGNVVEFADVCKARLGRPGEFVAIVFSVLAIVGAAIVFWVLMSNFLYNSGAFIHGKKLQGLQNFINCYKHSIMGILFFSYILVHCIRIFI